MLSRMALLNPSLPSHTEHVHLFYAALIFFFLEAWNINKPQRTFLAGWDLCSFTVEKNVQMSKQLFWCQSTNILAAPATETWMWWHWFIPQKCIGCLQRFWCVLGYNGIWPAPGPCPILARWWLHNMMEGAVPRSWARCWHVAMIPSQLPKNTIR